MAFDLETFRVAAAAAILSLTACTACTYSLDRKSGAGAYAAAWSAVHADAANSDYYPRRGAADLALAWSRTFDGMINLGPTSDGAGRLFVTTSGAGCR
ncbi:MAG TPA: hypothetical protein VLG14_00500, partial [Sphingomonas sp.]|nr:hypothetical protein [Sphingomonas sp.]